MQAQGLARTHFHIVIPAKSRIKKWAFDNAYMLILMGILFTITWIFILVLGVWQYVAK